MGEGPRGSGPCSRGHGPAAALLSKPAGTLLFAASGLQGRWNLSPGPGKPPPNPFRSSQGPADPVCSGPRGLLRTSPAGRGWGGSSGRGSSLLAPGLSITPVPRCGDWGCSAGRWEASLTPPFPPLGLRKGPEGFVNTLGAFCHFWTPCDFLSLSVIPRRGAGGQAWAQGVGLGRGRHVDRSSVRLDGQRVCTKVQGRESPVSAQLSHQTGGAPFSPRPLDSTIMPEPSSVRCLCVCVQAHGKPLPQESCHPLLRPLTPSVFLNPAPLPWRPQRSPYPSNDTLASRWAWSHSGAGRLRRGCWMCGGAPRPDRAAERAGDRVQHMNAPGGSRVPQTPVLGGGPQSRPADSTRIGPTSSTSGCLGCKEQAQAERVWGPECGGWGRSQGWRPDVAAASAAATRWQHRGLLPPTGWGLGKQLGVSGPRSAAFVLRGWAASQGQRGHEDPE